MSNSVAPVGGFVRLCIQEVLVSHGDSSIDGLIVFAHRCLLDALAKYSVPVVNVSGAAEVAICPRAALDKRRSTDGRNMSMIMDTAIWALDLAGYDLRVNDVKQHLIAARPWVKCRVLFTGKVCQQIRRKVEFLHLKRH